MKGMIPTRQLSKQFVATHAVWTAVSSVLLRVMAIETRCKKYSEDQGRIVNLR
jgi:hypothetical protein